MLNFTIIVIMDVVCFAARNTGTEKRTLKTILIICLVLVTAAFAAGQVYSRVVTDTVRAALAGVDCAVIEANHDPELLRTGPYPVYLKRRIASDHGHLSNESAGALAVFLAENGAQQLILGHLSRENNTPRAALDAVSQALTDAGFLPGEQPELYAAPADTPLVLAAGKACVCCR